MCPSLQINWVASDTPVNILPQNGECRLSLGYRSTVDEKERTFNNKPPPQKIQLSLTLTSVSKLSRFSGGRLTESNRSGSKWSPLGTGDFDLNVHHPACRAFPSLARFWRVWESSKILPCEQTLRGALAAGREKERELELRVWNLNSTSNSPLAPGEGAVNCHQSTRSRNERECKQTFKNTCQG